MAKKKEIENTLPQPAETEVSQTGSSIVYANDVVATIAGLAAQEVEGIADMCSVSSGLLNKSKNVTKGVKIEIGTEEVSVDLYVSVESGTPIQRAAHDVQENVKKAIESMTGLHVVRVDVHVQNVSFEKENCANHLEGQQASLDAGEKAEHEEKSLDATDEVETPQA